ncbi:kallikrein-14-like [Motacilla alba alba]|uniref:kallikrein-14-like n=1 Tax=Motacilla alba alba TaxID=1094192 RepID=UPI0018D58D4C|nr:kallikrein-14-like [Motacilla alba alba]
MGKIRAVEPLLLLLLLSGATLCQPPPCPPGQRAEGDGAGATCVPLSPEGDEDRIIGGYPCVPLSQPWQALIYGPLRCGGVLVRPLWVLTAAHCVRRGLRVRLGEDDLQRREGTEQERRVTLAVPHPRFDPATLDADLALLRLERPAAIGPAVRPLALPRACGRAGDTCLLSGWGTVTTPQGSVTGIGDIGDIWGLLPAVRLGDRHHATGSVTGIGDIGDTVTTPQGQ